MLLTTHSGQVEDPPQMSLGLIGYKSIVNQVHLKANINLRRFVKPPEGVAESHNLSSAEYLWKVCDVFQV